jgi:tetratricopeptide (TPR) repeat protein
MLNGQRFHLVIILVIALASTLFLYSRPKVVVKDEDKTGKDQAVQQNNSKETDKDNHAVHLSEAGEKSIQKLDESLKTATDNAAKVLIYNQIAEVYSRESVFDSAGHYLMKVAEINPSEATWTQAGDTYYQAYSLALNGKKIEEAIDKTRLCYNKVLALDPQNLHAKTNLAMTYVTSDSPMTAISMIREVLDNDPNYVPALMSLGALSMQSNQFDKAVGRFTQVLKISPGNVNAKLGLAYSLIELDKKEEAKGLFNEVLKEDIDKVLRDEVTKTLNSLK